MIPGQNINYAFQSKTSNRYHTNFFLVSKSDESAAIHWFDSLRDTQTNQKNNFDEHFDLISLDDTVSFSHSYSGTLTLPNTISGNYSLIALTTSVSGENHIYSFPLDISFPYDLQLETPDFAYK